ncbi:Transcription factor MYBC1 [Camellia lanceoleosa]|uniref:Transcription factor MYBC1 n=1 Tax=Camellia lanceoleosa TaxID=1840588 RepID=A0ACC0G8K0_9ERIC|nr:Transcription factor MYBC1 [Camellia lanceoleosa]
MREDDSNWFSKWEDELPSPEELMPLSQTLITPDLAIAFDIRNPNNTPQPPPPPPLQTPSSQPNSAEFDSASAELAELGAGSAGDEPARTLKRPRLVWTPQLHKSESSPKYRLYLKRMQGISAGGGGGGGGGSDPATDHLFASSPVPPHFLHPGRSNSEHFLPFVPVSALQHHHQMAAAAVAVGGHSQLQNQYRHMGHFGSQPNGQFEHSFLARQSQSVHRMGAPLQSHASSYVEDMESGTAANGRKVLTLFPTGDD